MTLRNSAVGQYLAYQIDSIKGTRGTKRNNRIKQNAIVSLFTMVLSNLISFILMPVVIGYLDVTRYGLWLTINSVLAWVFLLDMGLSGGLRTRLAEAMATKDIEQANILINTSYAFMAMLMFALVLVYYSVSPLINWIGLFNAPFELKSELNNLMMVVVIFFLVRFVLQIVNGMFTAMQRNSVSNIMNLVVQLLSLCSILALAKSINGSLFWIGFIYSISPLIVLSIGTLIFFNSYKQFRISVRYIRVSALRKVLSIGIYEFIDQLAFIILMSATNFIIANVSSPAEVVPYHVTMRMFGLILTVFTMATNPLTPAFTEAYALRDLKWIKAIFTKTNILVILCTLGVIFMILLSKPLFSYLVKGKTDLSYVLVSIIAIKTIVRVYSSVFTKFLTGCGKVRLIAITSMINAIVYILLVVGIGFRYNIGVNGVIFIQLILGLITASIAVIQTKKVVQNKATGIWGH